MAQVNTDADWEFFAATDPYWAVLTDDCYRQGNLTEQALEDFDASGASYVSFVFDTIEQRVAPKFQPHSCLDFGCGVGRLVIPFARRNLSVVGVDVADSMLAEARRRCAALGLTNVELVKGDDALSRVPGSFDLIHSFIVFQHIPCARGQRLFGEMFKRLKPGGVGVVHFAYAVAKRVQPVRRGVVRATLSFVKRTARRVLHRARGTTPVARPVMQMNKYNLNELLLLLQQAGVQRMWLECTEDQGECGVILFFKKPRCHSAAR